MDSERRRNSLHGDAMQEETRKSNGRINFILCEKVFKPVGSVQVHCDDTEMRDWWCWDSNAERGKASSMPRPRALKWLK